MTYDITGIDKKKLVSEIISNYGAEIVMGSVAAIGCASTINRAMQGQYYLAVAQAIPTIVVGTAAIILSRNGPSLDQMIRKILEDESKEDKQ